MDYARATKRFCVDHVCVKMVYYTDNLLSIKARPFLVLFVFWMTIIKHSLVKLSKIPIFGS